MKILALECASVSASVCIYENGKVIGEDFVRSGLTHSQTLMPMLKKVLDKTTTDIKTVDVFSCTAGPGSFTGVRIGVSAIKGMADAQNKPCFSTSTLETIAYPHRNFDGVVCAVMDARCNQVYTASFSGSERLFPDEAILIDELGEKLKKLNKKVILAGDGAELVYNKLNSTLPLLFIADEDKRYPTASSVAELTFEKINSGEKTISSKEILPMYLRLPQAQRELNNKLKKQGE